MEIIKKYNTGFTQISNSILYDAGISLRAKGLYAYLFSKPDDWEFRIDVMAKELAESKGRIYTAIRELIVNGYIIRRQLNNKGVWGGIVYEFISPEQTNRDTVLPCAEKSVYGKNSTHNNTNILNNTDKYINNNTSNKKKEKIIINNNLKERKENNENVEQIASLLSKILSSYYKREFPTRAWKQPIERLLNLDKVPAELIIKALQWYELNIGKEYVPVIESGKALREKFTKLQNAMKREELDNKAQEFDLDDWY